jgi:hypothetical protein
MVAVITLTTDVRILADDEDAEVIAQRVVVEELRRSRAAIADRLTELGVEVSIQDGLT